MIIVNNLNYNYGISVFCIHKSTLKAKIIVHYMVINVITSIVKHLKKIQSIKGAY